MRLRKCSLPIKFLLSIGLVVSLSGCYLLPYEGAKDFIKISSNITTPNRTTYPAPTKETCSVTYRQKNNLTVAELRNAINYGIFQNVVSTYLPWDGGAVNWRNPPDTYAVYEKQKIQLLQAVQVISTNLQALKAEAGNTGNFAVNVNTGGFAAFEAVSQVNAWLKPKSLGTYLTGCLKYTQDGSGMTLLQQVTALGSDFKNVKFPQPTLETCTTEYLNTHPKLENVASAAQEEAFLNSVGIVTVGETPQGIMSQLQQLATTYNQRCTQRPVYNTYVMPNNINTMNPVSMGEAAINNHMYVNMYNQFYGQPACKSVLYNAENKSFTTYSIATEKAQNHANYINLIEIYAQFKPVSLANYDVGCFMLKQKNHIKLQ
ncbi:MAG: hypothetical protein J6P19_01705 [Acetobacter sp.]|nr:hypothetical protein [Acetobacter sp.]